MTAASTVPKPGFLCKAVGRAGVMKSRVAAYALTQSMSSHDLQQARVICKTEHLGGAGDLPAVFVEGGENDLTFGLSLQRLQSARSSCRIRDVIDLLCLNLRWNIGDVDDGSVRRNHHPLEDRKSTRLNSSHGYISYAVFCLI